MCIIPYLLFIVMLCVTGCQSVDTHTTLKRALPEVKTAILVSRRSNKDYLLIGTNDIPGISYTLTLAGSRWPIDMRSVTIHATMMNPNETRIGVRCDSTCGDVIGMMSTRRIPSVERHTLASIIKAINGDP